MKNNKRGVVLILFLLLFPVICIVFVLLIDGINMKYIKQKTESILYYVLDNPDDAEKILELNEIEYKNYLFYEENNTSCISVELEKDSIFGFIINKTSFEIKTNVCKK